MSTNASPKAGERSNVRLRGNAPRERSGVQSLAYSDVAPRFADDSAVIREIVVSGEGALIISDFPDDENHSLLSLAATLGQAFPSGYELDVHPMENDVVYRIESREDGHGIRGDSNFLITSTTAYSFSCHTDGFCSVSPADFICMLCVRPESGHGDTMLIHVRDLLTQLSDCEIGLLRESVYPAKQGLGPILYKEGEETRIRFNKLDIDHFSAAYNYLLPLKYRRVVERVEALCSSENVPHCFHMSAGDCLVMNNRVVLHGRTGFSGNSERLMKRVWVRANVGMNH